MSGPVTATDVTYRALFCDLLTDELIDALPLTGVEFDDYIGKSGQLRATVPLPDDRLAERARKALRPGRTAVWLERGSDIWWGGILWTCAVNGDERGRLSAEIQAGTFDTYLDHRFLTENKTFSGEQFEIARDLVRYAQQGNGDIGIEYGTDVPTKPRPRSYSFAWTDLARIRELLDQAANVEDGFEWRIRCYRRNGKRIKELQLGAPSITSGSAEIVLDRPGQVLSYSLPTDASVQANVWVARGDSADSGKADAVPQMSEVKRALPKVSAGWPQLDDSSDHSGISDKNLLTRIAAAQLAMYQQPQVIPEVTVRVDSRITSDLLGATLRLRFRDGWHRGEKSEPDKRYRVVGVAVSPPERGRGETATFCLEPLEEVK
ncbi:hypothetical protein CTZ27_27505 [Streptomyces griseocarneus]|nr:hypothetical protein CTZ27_27505 [Streptomyces griseocarneus]